MNATSVEELRKSLPALLTVKEYCDLTRRCLASAYTDFKTVPGLAWKQGRSTRVDRDVALQLIANMHPWTPENERVV